MGIRTRNGDAPVAYGGSTAHQVNTEDFTVPGHSVAPQSAVSARHSRASQAPSNAASADVRTHGGIVLPAGAVHLRTISYLFHSEINILIHGFQNPDQGDWDQLLSEIPPLLKANALRGVLVRSAGGGPNPRQRSQVVEVYDGQDMPVANVSDSMVTRAITTAISWFYKGTMRSFSPSELPTAIDFLGVPVPQREPMLDCIASLCAARGFN